MFRIFHAIEPNPDSPCREYFFDYQNRLFTVVYRDSREETVQMGEEESEDLRQVIISSQQKKRSAQTREELNVLSAQRLIERKKRRRGKTKWRK